MVTGHDYIKTALSPLDFAYKLLMLEYRGRTDLADDSENVDITNLQGFKNGAFETYRKAEIDDWDFEQVIKDPELGGFKKDSNSKRKKLPKTNGKPKSNERGITCPNCGNFMRPTGSNCYDCNNCGEKLGGCGI
jgi:DNA-directed RNA polymerase subunit RPC12/RpoP